MIDRFRIATRDMPERDRVPVMRDFYGRMALGVDIDPAPEARFEMEIETVILASVGLGRGVISPMAAARNRRTMQDGNAGILFSAFTETFHVSDRVEDRLPVEPGQVLAAPLDCASDWTYTRRGEVSSVWIDLAALQGLVPALRLDGPIRIERSNPLLSLLYTYAAAVRGAASPNAAEAALYARQLTEIAAMLLADVARPDELGATAGLRAARLAALKKDVISDFRRPDLSVAELARRHGISPRYVQMLFEADGSTFTAYLQAQRLDFALRRLTDPRHDAARIADVAFAAGFSDLSTFNRLFRRRFGETPTAMRARR